MRFAVLVAIASLFLNGWLWNGLCQQRREIKEWKGVVAKEREEHQRELSAVREASQAFIAAPRFLDAPEQFAKDMEFKIERNRIFPPKIMPVIVPHFHDGCWWQTYDLPRNGDKP